MKLLHAAALAFCLPSFLCAAPGDLDAPFVANIGAGLTPSSYPTFDSGTGATNAVALQSTGKIIAGGNISRYNNTGELTALKRLNADGTLDTSFNPGGAGLAATGGQPEVNALYVDAQDRIYVGGTFTSYNGTARSCLLRLNPDGTLDTTFNNTGLGGSNRYVMSIAEQADGRILVAGAFTTINGTSRFNVARLNSDGSVDATFSANAVAFSIANVFDCVGGQADGKILVSGSLNSRPAIARLNADGTLDASFAPVFGDDFGRINKLLALPDGRVLLGGDMALPGYQGTRWLAAVDAGGALDTAFMANLGTGPNGWVGGALVLQPDGKILVAGKFVSFNGQPRASIARIFPDGTLDASFAPAPYSDNHAENLTHFYAVAVQPDAKIVAGGWVSRVTDPQLETYSLTRFTGDFSTGPGTLRVQSSTAVTAENAGSLTLRVSRFGGLAGSVSVNYATANGTALAGSDYTATSGTLTWAAGEGGSKTIVIPILQDTAQDGVKTFTLALSNPTGGATLGAGAGSTVVTIRDDDSVPTITRQPASLTVDQGEGFLLSVRFDTVLAGTVQWQQDTGTGFADLSGATGLDYRILVADPAVHAGTYRVRVTNVNGTTTSQVATVTVNIPAGAVVPAFAPTLPGPVLASTIDAAGRIVVTQNLGLRRMTVAGVVDANFAPVFNSTVTSVLAVGDAVLAGGYFTTTNGATTSYLARFAADGTLDAAFAPALAANKAVQTLAPGANGKFYVGHSAGGGLRRLNANGTLDVTFNAPATLGSDLQGAVYAVRELSDGKVLVGFMNGRNGAGFSYLVQRLNADGTLDASFTSPALNWYVNALDVLPDGRIVIGGRFSTVAGVARQRVAILSNSGALDAGFAFELGANGPVEGLAYRDGRLYAWGQFATVGNVPQAGITRLNLDGTVDANFKIGAGASPTAVNTVQFLGDGNLFLGGNFTSFKGVARSYTAQLIGNVQIGAVGFATTGLTVLENAGTLALTLRRYGPATEAASVTYTAVSGSAVLGEDFLAASGTVSWAAGDAADKTVSVTVLDDQAIESTESFRVVLANPTGPVTTAAAATITITDNDTPVSITQQPVGASVTEGQPFTLTAAATSPTPLTYQWYRNGQPIAGATAATYSVTNSGSADVGAYFLRVTNAAGFVDTATVSVAVALDPARRVSTFNLATSLNGQVRSLVTLPDGGAIVGGDFSSVTGLTGGAYLFRIDANGAVVPTFNPAPNSGVTILLRQPDGKILVAGSFGVIAGASRTYLARLNADGTSDVAFNTALGSGPNNTVSSLLLLPDGRIAVGGFFTAFNGAAGTSRLALLKADGTLDTTFTSPITNGSVTALAHQDGAQLLVGGTFTTFTQRFVRLSLAGVRDANFAPAATTTSSTLNRIVVLPDGRIALFGQALAGSTGFSILDGATGVVAQNVSSSAPYITAVVQDNGKIVAGGNFSFSSNVRIARFAGTGQPATYATDAFATGTGFNNTVNVIALTPEGQLWVGGNFTTYNGVSVSRLVKLNGEPPLAAIVTQPVESIVSPGGALTFSVFALGSGELSYQWRKNGTDLADGGRISGATGATLTITNAVEADEGVYSVVVTNTAANRSVTSAAAAAVVLGAPEILVAPTGGSFAADGAVTLSATVRGVAPLTYQWRRNGQLVVDGARVSGASTATLNITGALVTDGGAYTLTVTNALGSVTTATFNVSVELQPGVRVPAFTALAANSTVHHVLPLPDGGALVGGNFTAAGFTGANGTQGGPYLVRVKANGEVDPAFTVTVDNNVDRFAWTPDGGVIVAGIFSQVNGQARPGLFRLTPELAFDPAWSAASVGVSGRKRALAVDSTGRIYVGGNYTGFGTYAPILERFSAAGVKDTVFKYEANLSIYYVSDIIIDAQDRILVAGALNPGTGSRPLVRFLPGGGYDPAFAQNTSPSLSGANMQIALQSDGSIIAGSTTIRRLTPDGALDNGFQTYNQGVVDLAVLYNDRIVAVGALNQGGVGNIARLEPDGTPTVFGGAGTGLNAAPDFIAVAEGGTLWIGGISFSSYNGQTATRIVALNGDVANLHVSRQPAAQIVDPGATAVLRAGAIGTSAISYQWLKDGVAVQDGGRITGATSDTLTLAQAAPSDTGRYSLRVTNDTGGTLLSTAARLVVRDAPVIVAQPASAYATSRSAVSFSVEAIGVAPMNYQWRKDGAPIAGATSATLTLPAIDRAAAGLYSVTITNARGTVTSQPAALSVGTLASGTPVALTSALDGAQFLAHAALPDGRFYLGGSFMSVAGHATYNVARFNADGSVDKTFVSPYDSGASCSALAVLPDGKLFVYGPTSSTNFSFYSVITAQGAYATFDASALSGIAGSLQKAEVGPDGKLYLGFTYFSSAQAARPMLVRVNLDGTQMQSFTGEGTGGIYDFEFLSGGRVAIAGNWIKGGTTSYLAILDSTLAPDATFAAAVSLNARLFELAVMPDGDLLLGGQFSTVNGASRQYLARLEQSGALDTTFLSGLAGPNGSSITDLQVTSDGKILVVGAGTQFNGTVVNQIVRVLGNGVIDDTFPRGTSPNIGITAGSPGFARELAGGALLIGSSGNMTIKGVAASALAYLTPPEDGTLEIVAAPAAVTRPEGAEITLSVAARGAAALTFQWARNGNPIVGATSPTYAIVSLGAGSAGDYAVTVSSGASSLTTNPATVAIGADTGGQPTLGSWLAEAGIPENQRGPDDDPDGDGISNLLEYALDMNPALSGQDGLPEPTVGEQRLYYTYIRARPELLYEVETSSNLASGWSTAGVDQGTPAPDGITTASVAFDGAPRFFRLKITRP